MSSFMKLFNRALVGNDYSDYVKLLEFAIERGYIVHKDCCTEDVKNFLETKPCRSDFSQTFYKTWDDVKRMDRFEQFCDQIIYYLTRYNPNDDIQPDIPKVLIENLKPILPITPDEASKKCMDMLASGIALTQDTIKCIFDVFDKCDYTQKININLIKNREARIMAFKVLSKLPADPTEFLRYLIYLATDSLLLIKNTETYQSIVKSTLDVSKMINEFGITKLATIYSRYKTLFLAFKHANKENIHVINRLTKKSKNVKTKPKNDDANYFQTLLGKTDGVNKDKLIEKLKDLNNFKKIALLETINLYLLELDYRVFSIRNSKIWVKLEDKNEETKVEKKIKKPTVTFPLPFKKYKTSKQLIGCKDKNRLKEIYSIVYDSLILSIKSKYTPNENKVFRLPNECILTAPRSEKSFVGEYPFGSSLTLNNKDAIIGISWDLDDNAADLDLSLLNMNNQKIGWNARFKDSKSQILFSGDIVEAPGTELIFASNGFDFDAGVYINLYRMQNGKDSSKASFKFYVANEEIQDNKLTRNYMIDPNHIKFSTKIAMESKEMLIGFVTEGKFIFSTFRSNDSRVSYGNKYNQKVIQFSLIAQKCHLKLRDILLDAGFKQSTSDQRETLDQELFEFNSKAELINFFKN
ncbi:unnamed protein product [Brachionus calyciflorus]|uniref:Uncharacterized protein n=1 Tax=Brachionus calyciflorus TaxID=104777 RepID=A0A813M7K9_9BILA|nr:unnamed protein product [Brachionus calyciflorus]